MFQSTKKLSDSRVTAKDGDIGQVHDAFFDDRSWAIRYLVVDTGSWLNERKVLISPYSVKPPIGGDRHIHVDLTQQQVKDSPDVDTHQPVSRQNERDFLGYYDYPEYWSGGGLWAMGAMPYPAAAFMSPAELEVSRAARERDFKAAEVNLRSSNHVTGYEIEASDGNIGRVDDFVFDEDSWAIRYLVVDTSNWWPMGRKVLIGIHWTDSIDWATQKIHVGLTRAQVQSSPEFDDLSSIAREYETRLHKNYQRPGYWI